MTFYEGDKFNALFSTNAPEIRAAAESGDASAQVLLGWRLIESSLKNDEKADKWINGNSGTNAANEAVEVVKWFFKAADQGREDAENNLGTCYANGFGVKKNEAEAVKWFVKAAKQGDNESSLWLGRAYETGEGVETNITLAEQWYRHAALHENVSAQEWFRKAAENGDASAQCFVGQLYDFGFVGVNVPLKDHPGAIQTDYPENPNEAVKWYRQAAAQGNATAQNNLGAHYLTGDGIAMDYVEAYKWLNLAAASTDDEASDIAGTQRDNLAKIMTSDQIAEAQELSREFKPRTESGSNNSTSSDQPVASGTGFFITDDGYLISNYHVVKDATKVRLLTSAGLIDAKVVQVDAANDLALLKADGRFAPLPIAASRSVNLGGTVATVGFPDIGLQGFAPKLAKGEIASLSGAADDPRYFQISVPVQPGNSGGALVDDWGNVIGIVSAKLDASVALAASGALPENVNYAVKSSFLLSFLESVPAVSAKLKAPNTKDEKFEDVVKSAQAAAVLVLVY
ncbi:MAG TPA: tetratricopeptide repeat-containing serine protease family protein [Candidatus Limnocylindrales bacterium]|nr:tetratricopeptide repeat-containing serine protease family protein [Candidatus Limnocylindrales bacterium]